MDITNVIELVPTNIKQYIMDYQDVKLKDGRYALRVVLDRKITAEEKEQLVKIKRVVGANCVGHYQYAPEIRRSYFYIPY